MKLKTIIFIILSIIFIIIIFKFNKVNVHNENDKKPDTILNLTNQVQDNVKTPLNDNEKNKKDSQIIKDLQPQKINDRNKTKYTEFAFKNHLKANSKKTVPGTKEWFLAPKTLAIDKKKINKFDTKILWEDDHFYYINEGDFGMKGTAKNFNPNFSLVSIDKNTLEIGIINGYFIITLAQFENNPKQFSKIHGVKFISYYPNSNILIVRMKKGKNISETFQILKQSPTVKSVNIEVIDGFPVLN
ncbi:hypothetical protein [Silvanigrella aquatica]|uniref:Uncharacterized protein n=1 Tax=Silvanigrella aquatica TaxID=1915309 RepID=A0A1L4CXD5_9BACT|nr:hypothetical protein [Silvanigrella aquatica]APJ02612.1 hypothetical protein AXG55_01150 [Silvanigrella aquatica]